METLRGIIFSLIYLQLVILLAHCFRAILWPILLGGAARLVCAWLIYGEVIAPPGTQNDAKAFERRARAWADSDWDALLGLFDPSNSHVISWLGAVFYKVFGPSPIMLNVVNAFVSVVILVLTYRLALRLIGRERARTVTWIAALFPYAILYGSVYRREVFGVAGFMVGLLYVVRWQQQARLTAILQAVAAFSVASLFHGAYSVSILVVGVLALWDAVRELRSPERKGGGRVFAVGALGGALVIGMVAYAAGTGLKLGSFGDVHENLTSVDGAIEKRTVTRVSDGGSSYPGMLQGEDPFRKPWVIPARIVYFLFSPFPWDIRSAIHVLGFIATLVFTYVAASAWRSRGEIRARRDLSAIFLILAAMVFVFGASIDNVGTSIRHRTKFVFALLALCHAPLLRRPRRVPVGRTAPGIAHMRAAPRARPVLQPPGLP